MLWDVVYEFFVKYIFGGWLGYDLYGGIIGGFATQQLEYENGTDTASVFVKLGDYIVSGSDYEFTGMDVYMSLGNYLSLLATIISMVVIVVFCCLLIKKIYNICAHVIG